MHSIFLHESRRLPLKAAFLFFLPACALAVAASQLSAAMCPSVIELEASDLINAERAAEGLPSLAVELRLVEAAYLHSMDMAANNIFRHTGSDGSSPWDRFSRASYPMQAGAENIAAGYTSPAELVYEWMNSQGHRANILNVNVTHMGVGYAYLPSSLYGGYWTADFGASFDSGVLLQGFSDVTHGYWAGNYIKVLACNQVTSGCGNGMFCPEDPVTRSQMAVFILKALGHSPALSCTGTMFSDVNAAGVGEAFCRYIEEFSRLGITSGCRTDDPATQQNEAGYCPGGAVSRASMAVFLVKGFLR